MLRDGSRDSALVATATSRGRFPISAGAAHQGGVALPGPVRSSRGLPALPRSSEDVPIGYEDVFFSNRGLVVKELSANSLLPFVPSGKDYEASRRLFAELGFEEIWENAGYAGFRNGRAEFILQRFDDEHFASNFMVRLNVDDLTMWWETISRKGLDRTYPGVRLSGPTDHPWGREVNLIDLAGVCWHIGQRE